MYVWPGFNPEIHDPDEFFASRNIEFDGELFIRYRVERTFRPLTAAQIAREERLIGAKLPADYTAILQSFGEFHLPGKAGIQIEPPAAAVASTRNQWCYDGTPLQVIAISPYHEISDGNSIGFIRSGDAFLTPLFEFEHDRHVDGEDPTLWTKPLRESLSEFLLAYLDRDT